MCDYVYLSFQRATADVTELEETVEDLSAYSTTLELRAGHFKDIVASLEGTAFNFIAQNFTITSGV